MLIAYERSRLRPDNIQRLVLLDVSDDSLYWMENFGDEQTENCPTGFCRHAAISTYVGALVMRLADDKVLPFNYTNYAVVMRGYADNCAP